MIHFGNTQTPAHSTLNTLRTDVILKKSDLVETQSTYLHNVEDAKSLECCPLWWLPMASHLSEAADEGVFCRGQSDSVAVAHGEVDLATVAPQGGGVRWHPGGEEPGRDGGVDNVKGPYQSHAHLSRKKTTKNLKSKSTSTLTLVLLKLTLHLEKYNSCAK